MTRCFVMFGLGAVALVVGSTGWVERSSCSAKETKAARRTPGTVAVLDVTRLFKESKQFNAAMQKLKADVKKAEEKVKSNRDKLKTQREEMEKLPSGSEERMKREEYQGKLEAALEASTSFQKKAFLSREARIYFDFYKRLEDEVAAYAKEQRIDTVIRIAVQEADVNDAQSVLTYINRPVVWYSPASDITLAIVARLESPKRDSGEDEDSE